MLSRIEEVAENNEAEAGKDPEDGETIKAVETKKAEEVSSSDLTNIIAEKQKNNLVLVACLHEYSL